MREKKRGGCINPRKSDEEKEGAFSSGEGDRIGRALRPAENTTIEKLPLN